jgi:hypothetical protein
VGSQPTAGVASGLGIEYVPRRLYVPPLPLLVLAHALVLAPTPELA